MHLFIVEFKTIFIEFSSGKFKFGQCLMCTRNVPTWKFTKKKKTTLTKCQKIIESVQLKVSPYTKNEAVCR